MSRSDQAECINIPRDKIRLISVLLQLIVQMHVSLHFVVSRVFLVRTVICRVAFFRGQILSLRYHDSPISLPHSLSGAADESRGLSSGSDKNRKAESDRTVQCDTLSTRFQYSHLGHSPQRSCNSGWTQSQLQVHINKQMTDN